MTANPRPTIEDMLAAMLDQLQQTNTLIGLVIGETQSSVASSIQIEDAAKGPPRVTTKVYAGSAPDVDGAIEAHALAHRLAEEKWRNDWKETLDYVRSLAIAPQPAAEAHDAETLPDFGDVSS